jgi:AcrR family transcriptional regulator
MAQYLKDEIQQSIHRAALKVFALKGFRLAKMTEIAAGANVSTGNVYRYYENKEVLFYALITDEFVEKFKRLFEQRVRNLKEKEGVKNLERDSPFYMMNEEILQFCIENRLQVVILLGHAKDTKYENFPEEIIRMAVKLVFADFIKEKPETKGRETILFNLEQIYRNGIGAMVQILTKFENEDGIRNALGGFSKYHLAGLKGFFE